MSFRKRKLDELDNLVNNPQLYDEEEDSRAEEISFQNGETSLILRQALGYYSAGKCDYDENLIGSSRYWHQIIVRFCKKLKDYFLIDDILFLDLPQKTIQLRFRHV